MNVKNIMPDYNNKFYMCKINDDNSPYTFCEMSDKEYHKGDTLPKV